MGSEPIFEPTPKWPSTRCSPMLLGNEFTRRPVKVTSLVSPAELVTVKERRPQSLLFSIAARLLVDRHDLIHKTTG